MNLLKASFLPLKLRAFSKIFGVVVFKSELALMLVRKMSSHRGIETMSSVLTKLVSI